MRHLKKMHIVLHMATLFAAIAVPLAWFRSLDVLMPEVLAGVILAILNGLAASAINLRAQGASARRFFLWSLLVHGIRIFLLLLIIFLVYQNASLKFDVFLASSLAGYFTALFGEIWILHRGEPGVRSPEPAPRVFSGP